MKHCCVLHCFENVVSLISCFGAFSQQSQQTGSKIFGESSLTEYPQAFVDSSLTYLQGLDKWKLNRWNPPNRQEGLVARFWFGIWPMAAVCDFRQSTMHFEPSITSNDWSDDMSITDQSRWKWAYNLTEEHSALPPLFTNEEQCIYYAETYLSS